MIIMIMIIIINVIIIITLFYCWLYWQMRRRLKNSEP